MKRKETHDFDSSDIREHEAAAPVSLRNPHIQISYVDKEEDHTNLDHITFQFTE